jgi:hypothetical protein
MSARSVSHGSSWFVLGVCAALIGCGSAGSPAKPLAPAKGTVKFKGAPVVGATVMFSAETGNPAMAMTNEAGEFTLFTDGKPGVVIAKCKVTISKPAEKDAKVSPDMKPADMEKMIREKKSLAPPKSPIPGRYATPKGTPLEADVSANGEKNVFEFNLVD